MEPNDAKPLAVEPTGTPPNSVTTDGTHDGKTAASAPQPAAETVPVVDEGGARTNTATLQVSAQLVSEPASVPPPATALPRRPLKRIEVTVCGVAIVCWVILVAGGVAVATKPYLDIISPPTPSTSAAAGVPAKPIAAEPGPPAGFIKLAEAWFFVITCYTFSNVAILCCLAAAIGAIGRSAGIDDAERKDASTDFRTLCASGVIRGFFMYLVILSGILVLADQKYDNIEIAQYLKLVGICSVLSFAVGYDPHIFVTFFQRVGQWTANPNITQGK